MIYFCIMALSKDLEDKIQKLKDDAAQQWAKMSDEEKEETRKAARDFEKKVGSCYPDTESVSSRNIS